MRDQILRNVRVLIVEDQSIQLEAFIQYLEMIDEDLRLEWGIDSFQTSPAESVEEAEAFLKAADSPYDILILDLGLPKRKGDPESSVQGKDFLESLNKNKVKEVIIVSITKDYEYVIKAVRTGAVDFIGKPFKLELLQARVIESWKRVIEKDSANLLQERFKDLAYYNERGLAYLHTVCFGTFADDVIHKTTKLEEYAYNRYGLNRKRDSQDLLIQSLMGLEASVNKARQAWVKLRVPSLPQEEEYKVAPVEAMLRELGHSLLPCLVLKKVKLDIQAPGKTNVLTFQNDVQAILKEILLGALAELADHDSPRDEAEGRRTNNASSNLIRIEVSSQNGQARVKFIDNLRSIPDHDAEQINTGSFTTADRRFSRVWGLAVMQHIAVLGGGRLIVEPQKQGNVITFLIPLDSNA